MVAKTETYTYTQPVVAGRPDNLYHGEARGQGHDPDHHEVRHILSSTTPCCRTDAAREKDKATRTAMFTRALENMKTFAKGGTVPRPAPRGAAPPASGAPGGRGN